MCVWDGMDVRAYSVLVIIKRPGTSPAQAGQEDQESPGQR